MLDFFFFFFLRDFIFKKTLFEKLQCYARIYGYARLTHQMSLQLTEWIEADSNKLEFR